MKTSNKILIGIAAFLIVSTTSLLIAGKMSITSISAAETVALSGVNQTEDRNVDDFSGVHASAAIQVFLKQGPKKVVVEADENIMEYVKTDVVNGVLKIGYKKMKSWNNKKRNTKVYVSTPQLNSLGASSSGSIQCEHAINADKISISTSSSGHIDVEIAASTIDIGTSSGGHINISGTSKFVDASASSGGHINGYGLTTDDGEANASSGGHIQLSVNHELEAGASSGGSIKYKGDASVREHESSGGRVSRAD